VTNYSPLQGLRGTILTIHMIADALHEPFCFYLIALEGVHIQEPLWFENHDVELIGPAHVDVETENDFLEVEPG